jgi:hypothetical protein
MAPTASFVALKDAGEPAESTDPLFGAGVPDFGEPVSRSTGSRLLSRVFIGMSRGRRSIGESGGRPQLDRSVTSRTFAEPRREPAAAARSERSLAGRVAASMGASPQVRGHRPVVRALPRPSMNAGASIERFGRPTMRTKPGLKVRYSLAETCLVTSSRHRKWRARVRRVMGFY